MKNYFSKILICIFYFSTCSFFVFAQKKKIDNKKVQEEIRAKKTEDIEKEIKEIEKNASKKNTNSKSKKVKKQQDRLGQDSIITAEKTTGKILTGIASFYSASFEGKQTANGEIFRHSKLTCASNKFPLGTWLKITNLKNNKTIIVKVNDRMHPRMKRLVDLTLTGAKKLDFVAAGLTQVKAEVIKKK